MTYYEQYLELEEDLKRQGFGVVVDYVRELHAEHRAINKDLDVKNEEIKNYIVIVKDLVQIAKSLKADVHTNN